MLSKHTTCRSKTDSAGPGDSAVKSHSCIRKAPSQSTVPRCILYAKPSKPPHDALNLKPHDSPPSCRRRCTMTARQLECLRTRQTDGVQSGDELVDLHMARLTSR